MSDALEKLRGIDHPSTILYLFDKAARLIAGPSKRRGGVAYKMLDLVVVVCQSVILIINSWKQLCGDGGI